MYVVEMSCPIWQAGSIGRCGSLADLQSAERPRGANASYAKATLRYEYGVSLCLSKSASPFLAP